VTKNEQSMFSKVMKFLYVDVMIICATRDHKQLVIRGTMTILNRADRDLFKTVLFTTWGQMVKPFQSPKLHFQGSSRESGTLV